MCGSWYPFVFPYRFNDTVTILEYFDSADVQNLKVRLHWYHTRETCLFVYMVVFCVRSPFI